MILVDCCPDPHAEPAGVGEYPFGADIRALCTVCGRGRTMPHQPWCPSVGAALHKRQSHPGLWLAEHGPMRSGEVPHGSVHRFQSGCRCLLCVRAWLDER